MLIQNENLKNYPSLPNCGILSRLDEPLGDFFIMEFYKNLSLDNLTCYDNEGIFHVERWKNIKDFEGLYQVSSFGRIKSFSKHNGIKEIIVKQAVNHYYHSIVLCKEKKRYTRKTHRLVALHFIPNPENKPQVNHKDTIIGHNFEWNLEWNTARENITHSRVSKIYSSKYTGVSWAKKNKKWKACIEIKNKSIHLGLFANEYDAHLAYQNKLKTI